MTASALSDLRLAAADLILPVGAWIAIVPVVPVTDPMLPLHIRDASPSRRNEFAAGRQAAHAALRAAGYPGDATVGTGADGLPAWPRGWTGSISHTQDLGAAVVVATNDISDPVIGLDLERILDRQTALQIAPEVAPELDMSQDSADDCLTVTRIFSAKEALYKALFSVTRQFREFDAARAILGQKATDLQMMLTQRWGRDWPQGTCFDVRQVVAGGHVLTVVWR